MSDATRSLFFHVDGLQQQIWTLPTESLAQSQHDYDLRACVRIFRDLSDETLALAVQKQFFLKDAFEELFARRYLQSYFPRWLRAWGATPADGEDVAQMLTVRCLESRLRHYNPRASLRSYLYRATRNLWLDTLRARRHERPESLESVDPVAGPDAVAVAEELLEQVRGLAGQLPPEEGQILEALLLGRNSSEIARSLDLSLHVVYQRTYNMRRRLERVLLER